jgi:hypothetical protein
MTMRETVLRVLSGQSPDYFIWPDAAAFEGAGPAEVEAVLLQLVREGLVEAGSGEVMVADPSELLAALPLRKQIAHRLKGTMPAAVHETWELGYRIKPEHRIDLTV